MDTDTLVAKYFPASNNRMSAFSAPLECYKETEKAMLLGYKDGSHQKAIWVPKKLVNYNKAGTWYADTPGQIYNMATIIRDDSANAKFFSDYALYVDSRAKVALEKKYDNFIRTHVLFLDNFIKSLDHGLKLTYYTVGFEDPDRETYPMLTFDLSNDTKGTLKKGFSDNYYLTLDDKQFNVPDSCPRNSTECLKTAVNIKTFLGLSCKAEFTLLTDEYIRLMSGVDKNAEMSDDSRIRRGQQQLRQQMDDIKQIFKDKDELSRLPS